MQVAPTKNTSQIPGFRLTVAQQMADYRKRLAERVAREREAQSLSRETLAYRAGVSDKTIKRIEEQKTGNPRPVTVRRIAEGLGLDATELRPPPEMQEDQLRRIEATQKMLLRLVVQHLADELEPELDAEIQRLLREDPPPSEELGGSDGADPR